jgi:hypothetical protein
LYSELKLIKAGVPQGSVLGPVLYLLYINDLPTTSNSTMATFADDTAAMAIRETVEISTRKLQSAVNKVAIWTGKWRIKLNVSKSVHIDFTNNKIKQQPISINGTKVPYANTAKYLRMNLDAKLRWKEHIKKEHDELNIKFREMYWLLGCNSELSVQTKLTLYKQIIRPVWSYGIQLHRGLGIEAVTDIIAKFAKSHEKRLQDHINIEASGFLNVNNITRRLQRKKPFEPVIR